MSYQTEPKKRIGPTMPPLMTRLANRRTTPRTPQFNYAAHVVEGGLYMGGLSFVAANSVLPRLVELLGGPAWVIGLSPMLMMIGFSILPLFTAHRIERLKRVMPLLIPATTLQRLPYLFAGLGLLYAGADKPALSLALVVLAPFLSGLFGGLIQPAWFELVAKTLSPNRRASVFALRNIISSAIGVCAGAIIAAVLHRYPGVTGYGVLHLFAVSFLFLSFLVFAQIRETDDTVRDTRNHVSLRENLRGLPALLGAQPSLGRFIVARMLFSGIFVALPYVAIHALRVTGKPDSFMGYLVTAQMVGGMVGNALAGYLGDRFGGKVCSIIGRSLAVAACAVLPFVGEPWAFVAMFALLGGALFTEKVGASTMGIEVAPFEKRATFMALLSFSNVPAMLGASVLSSSLWKAFGSFGLVCSVAAGLIALSLGWLVRVRDPRGMVRPG